MKTKFTLSVVPAAIATMLLAIPLTPASAQNFALSFEWGDLKRCTSGKPNRVSNPRFVVSGVPAGTKALEFKMVDLNVPRYKHGGGTVDYAGQTTIEPGAFKYKSPCPPDGVHQYQWTVKAKDGTGLFSDTLGEAKAVKSYP